MNAIVPFTGELIEPGAGITIVAALHPFKLEHERIIAPAGLTVAELVGIARKSSTTRIRCRMRVALGRDVLDENHWHRVRPKPGTLLLVRAVPEFGGGNFLQTLLTLAVVAAGIFLAPVIAPILGLSAGLVGAAITVGGQLLINALFPVAPPQLAQNSTSQTYSIAGGQNTANPWGPVPVILGQNRVYPVLGAKSYTEFAGSDQYLRMLFIWGYGALDIGPIKIGETLITDFDDVQVETRQGYISDGAVTLYPNEVLEDDFSIDLTAAAGWQTRTTDTAIEEISLDIVAPSGLMRIDSSGAKQNYTVNIRAEYSPTGLGTWTLLGVLNLTARSTDAIRKNLRLVVPSGQYDVRVEKTGSDYSGSDTVQEQVVWTALRGFRNTPPLAFAKPLAVTAIRIKATSQLNGTISQLNAICQSHVLAFNGSAWVADTVSRSPADLFRFVLQSPANAKPVADSGIDVATLELWWQYCKDNSFTFDMVRDATASVYDTLGDITAAGRAVQVFRDGLWSVVWDDPTSPIVQHFTTRNSNGFSGARSYNYLPHAFRVQFINANNAYAQDERIVYDDGFDITNATLFEQVEFPGVTDPGIIWRMGRFHIAQSRLRPEIYTLNVDIEHIVCTRGDRVLVTHDVPEWGMMSGRVIAVSGQTITIDEPVTMDAITSYVIRFRLADGTSLLRNVVTNDGEQTVLVLGETGAVPAIGDLWMFGVLNAESVVLRVRSVTPADDTSAKLTFVDDAPAISSADSGTIPDFNSGITAPVDLFAQAPINLRFAETFKGIDGFADYGAIFSWSTDPGQFPDTFETQYSDDVDGIWKDAGTVAAPTKTVFIDNLAAGQWSFRVRSHFSSGLASNWALLAHQTIEGVGAVPMPNVVNLRATYQDNTSALTWDEISDFRPVTYEIRKGDSWETALVLVNDQAHPPFATYGDATYWIAAKSEPLPGVLVYSSAPSSIVIAGSVLVDNVVATYDEEASGWTGSVSGPGTISSGLFQTTASGSPAYYEVPASHVFDVGFARPVRLNATWKATGSPANQDVLTDPDFLNNADVLGSGSARFVDSWVEVAVAQSGSSDVFALPDAFAPTDIFAGSTAFGAWTKFAPGVYVGQFFKFRLVLVSNDASVTAVGLNFTVSVDVPDRVDHVTNHSLAAGGETFTFTPDGGSTAVAFQGGPGSATVPAIQVTVLNSSAGDQVLITSVTLAHATIQVLNGGVGVARSINASFQGW